jgi:signal transduction histidine kinase
MSTDKGISLEHRLFTMATGISALVSFVLIIVDTFVSHTYISSFVGLAALTIFGTFYYFGRYKGKHKVLVTPYLCLTILIMNVAWFTGGGLNITNTFVFFLIMILAVILPKKASRPIFITIIFINLTIFTALEFLNPAYSQLVTDDTELQVVNTIVLFVAFAIGAYVLVFFKNNYESEREKVGMHLKALDEKNSEISGQNEELIQYQEEVMAQRDFIEEKNRILQEQAIELEIANNEIQRMNASLERTIDERTRELKVLNSDLDMLMYRSSHDFRRPLTTLMGLHEIARLTVKEDISKELFAKVYTTALTMDKMLLKFFMLYNINHFRNLNAGISLEEIVSKIDKNLIARKKNIDFQSSVNVRSYNANDERNNLIEIILENLIENSLIYNSKERIEVELSIRENNDSIHIIARDNGNGIPEAQLDKIFEIYFRGSTLSSGNGLGLYVVKRAVEALNASVKVESRLNEYTRFEVNFPV